MRMAARVEFNTPDRYSLEKIPLTYLRFLANLAELSYTFSGYGLAIGFSASSQLSLGLFSGGLLRMTSEKGQTHGA